MGVCCSKLDDNDIELSPVVVDIDNLPEIPPTPPTPRTPEPEPVVEPEKPKWDGGRPRLTIPAQFLTPEQRAERAEADLASETEQRSLSSNTSDNGRSGRNDPMYKGAQTRGSMIAGAALGAKKIIVTDQLLGWLKKIPLLAKVS